MCYLSLSHGPVPVVVDFKARNMFRAYSGLELIMWVRLIKPISEPQSSFLSAVSILNAVWTRSVRFLKLWYAEILRNSLSTSQPSLTPLFLRLQPVSTFFYWNVGGSIRKCNPTCFKELVVYMW